MNYFKEVAKYQKDHPRSSREAAMTAVSKGRKSGTVSGVKKKAKKRVAGTSVVGRAPKRKIAGTGMAKRKPAVKRAGNALLAQGKKALAKINSLEAQRSKAATKMAKDLYQVAINAEHKKYDRVLAQMKH